MFSLTACEPSKHAQVSTQVPFDLTQRTVAAAYSKISRTQWNYQHILINTPRVDHERIQTKITRNKGRGILQQRNLLHMNILN
jgi:hypothetical protein